MAVTFHRAFDMCKNPLQAFDTLAELGVARVLTSGQQSSAEKGLQLITELKAHSGVPIIMAGAGVRASNLERFLNAGVEELHSSAGKWIPSPMRYRNTGLSMSTDAEADEYSRYGVDGESVAEMKSLIERITCSNVPIFTAHHVAQYDACLYQAPAISTGAFFLHFQAAAALAARSPRSLTM
jgi:copper homeostasis protein